MSPHDITLLEVSFGVGGMSIMAGDAGIRDGEVYCQALELVPIFKGEHAGGWIGHQFFRASSSALVFGWPLRDNLLGIDSSKRFRNCQNISSRMRFSQYHDTLPGETDRGSGGRARRS